MSKKLQFKGVALKSLLKGAKALYKPVVKTLGPKGRNVVISKGSGAPLSTKDGVTVAKEIFLKDEFENLSAQLIKEVASKTADVAGDGTTTAIVLVYAILKESIKNVLAGANPVALKNGMSQATRELLKALEELACPVKSNEELLQVATVSSNNDPKIGEVVSQAISTVGNDGNVTVVEGKGCETELKVVKGMQFDKGYLSPYFVTNPEKMKVEMSNAQVLIVDKKVSNAKELVPILEKVAEKGGGPLLLIAEDVEGEALSTLVINKIKGGMSLCAVKGPAFGDRRSNILQDIAILTGATVVSEKMGCVLEHVDESVLGRVESVVINKEETTLVGGKGDSGERKKRIEQLRKEIESADSDYEQKSLEERLAKLSGGVAVISVGATTETEMKEKKARFEDALHAARAAYRGGVVPGGGVALIRASNSARLKDLYDKAEGDEKIGISIMLSAAYFPAIAIANNCGKEGNLIAEKIREAEGACGYNARTGCFEDLIQVGIMDPLLVTQSALQHASSVSIVMTNVECVVAEKPEPKEETPMGDEMMGEGGGMMPGGMGGMGGMMPDMGMM